MKYLLDTCAISDFIKGNVNTITQITNIIPSELATSSITVMEIHYGLIHNPQRAKRIRKVIKDFLASIAILPFSENDALHSANIRSQLNKKGQPIGAYDILIAGTALHYNLTLVTANTQEFTRIANLNIENWR